jgi:hypothetical protein
MAEPVLLVHGIANHDPSAFSATVAALQERVGPAFQLIEVFWGDLGGIGQGLSDTLPVLFPHEDETRAGAETEAFLEVIEAQRQKLMSPENVRAAGEEPVDAIYRATLAASKLVDAATLPTRGDDELYQALSEAIPRTSHLKQLRDEALLNAVGELLADFMQTAISTAPGTDGVYETRAWLGDRKEALKQFISSVDQLIGKVSAQVAGASNQWLRSALAEPVALTLGDVVAYHQSRKAIHERLFDVLDREAPGRGTAERPIIVLAHSLGGLVVLDAALGSEVLSADGQRRRLHIRHWITYGSQPAFFHVMTPREGLAPYAKNKPAVLPGTIARWTNLWHPMDLLAFTASPVFRLQGDIVPTDIRVDLPASGIVRSKLWLHSVYWSSPQLLACLKSDSAHSPKLT